MSKVKKIGFAFTAVILIAIIFLLLPRNVEVVKMQRFIYRFDSGMDTTGIFALAKALNDHYPVIFNHFDTRTMDTLEINLYSNRWNYFMESGTWGGYGKTDGPSVIYLMEQSWTDKEATKMAIHEFTHAVALRTIMEREALPLSSTFDKKFPYFPFWLWESVSQFEANQFVDPKTLPYLSIQRPTIDELNSQSKNSKIYECGYTIIEFFRYNYGQDKLVKLIRNYGDVKKVLGINEKQLLDEWYEFVKKKYLNPQPVLNQ